MSSYQFALIDKQRAFVGIGFQGIVRTWAELKQLRQIAIGCISYDQQPYFGIFKKLQAVPLRSLIDTKPFKLTGLKGETYTAYQHKIRQLQQHLKIGDIYQANYCYPFTARTTVTPAQLLHHFTTNQPTPYSALIDTPDLQLVSNSPELGIYIDGAQVECRPMKGTAARQDPKENLQHSQKDQAELDMITDVVRNDLAQFSVPGSVRVKRRRQIVGYKTVWQAQSIIEAKRRPGVDIVDTIKAILPFASVTGAPKQRATQILNNLESGSRGIYCGAIGYIQGQRKAEFNVAIRTAVLHNGQLTYWVGSGITLDSVARAEYQETLAKAAILAL